MKEFFKDDMFKGRHGHIIKTDHIRFSLICSTLDSSDPVDLPEIKKWPYLLEIEVIDNPYKAYSKNYIMLSEEMVHMLDAGDQIKAQYYYTYHKMDGAKDDIRYAIEECTIKLTD